MGDACMMQYVRRISRFVPDPIRRNWITILALLTIVWFAIFSALVYSASHRSNKAAKDAHNLATANRNRINDIGRLRVEALTLVKLQTQRQDTQVRKVAYTLCRSTRHTPKECKRIAKGVIIPSPIFTIKSIKTLGTTTLVTIVERGPKGSLGLRGPRGFPGLRGLMGFTGPRGLRGFAGSNGTDGKNGINGKNGIRGPQGIQGARGPQGLQGLQGLQGARGPCNGLPAGARWPKNLPIPCFP